MIKGVLFDMDGTVIDSTHTDFKAFQKALTDVGLDFTYEQYISQVGAKGEDIVRSIADMPDSDVQKILNRKAENFKEISRKTGLKPIDGVEELLLTIKKIPLWTALVTGSRKEKVDFIFDRVKLDQYFDIILTADDVEDGKPDPSGYLIAAKELHLTPVECLVFEDAILGIKSAKNAGMTCIAIASGSPKNMLAEADLIIDSYHSLNLSDYLEAKSTEKI